jgi:hypothetical protein
MGRLTEELQISGRPIERLIDDFRLRDFKSIEDC